MSTIGDLSVTSSVGSDDKLPIWSNANGVTRALPISVLDSRYLTAADLAELAASATVETFSPGDGITPNTFVPGVTTTLTLANQYFSAQNVEIFFDSGFQGTDQYTLLGYGLSFVSPIPVGVQKVFVRGGAVRLTGAPDDGTVTDVKLAAGSKVYNRTVDIVSIKDGTNITGDGITNVTPAFNAKLMASGGLEIQIPAGVYVIDFMAFPSGITIRGAGIGKTIIRRSPTSSASTFFSVGAVHDVIIEGITFDGNKSVNPSTCYGLIFGAGHYAVTFQECRVTSFSNGGIQFTSDANAANSTITRAIRNVVDNNGGPGITLNKVSSVDVLLNNVRNNTADGVVASNFVFPPVDFAQFRIRICQNTTNSNGGSGINVFGHYTGGSPSAPIYGTSLANAYFSIDDNLVVGNKGHGIVVQCEGFTCSRNRVLGNGDTSSPLSSAFAGIEVAGSNGDVGSNYMTGNSGYGCDLGGANNVNFHDNKIISNAKVNGNFGLNVGASSGCNVHDNFLYDNGPLAGGIQLMLTGQDGAVEGPFDQIGQFNFIHHNRIVLQSTQIGIVEQLNASTNRIDDNMIEGGNVGNAIQLRTPGPHTCKGNRQSGNYGGYAIPSASTLVVPDDADLVIVSGSTNISDFMTFSQNTFLGTISGVNMTNNGSSYTSVPTVVFTGGGGTGAAGVAQLSTSGKIIGVKMTSGGSGYTSSPSVSFTGGGGSAAAGTGILGCSNGEGREIVMRFTGTLTVAAGGRLQITGGSFGVTPGRMLTVRGDGLGNWFEQNRG